MMARVRRLLSDPTATSLWLGVTLAAVIAALVLGNPVVAMAGWVIGGIAAIAVAAAKRRRSR